jgi:hypothetical protein
MIFIVKIIEITNYCGWFIFSDALYQTIVYVNIGMTFPIDNFSILGRWINRLKLHNILYTYIIHSLWVINKFWKKLNTDILPLIRFSVMHNFCSNVVKVKGVIAISYGELSHVFCENYALVKIYEEESRNHIDASIHRVFLCHIQL